MQINKILPEFTWIKVKDGRTGTIAEVHDDGKKSNYFVEYIPHSQCEDDDSFCANNEDIIKYIIKYILPNN
ncbi:hypothetical protein C5L30_002280 [Companilactobacillus farciminis]|uniref:Uncharacterized protein n=2 Tax=Companilactobacillus farciminis TaxID=1612 RepID=A0A4R5NDQ2_9LACO|nr:hypothetical protein [Companilactobacillus farciminis]ATO45791.1 hypothetical protein LF20184_03020 [Companilactobacillus farciminis KCTC 3681 = DSM 20184]KRK61932.1 hypothetical protein FC68_GL000316 [Companilactobacillus farciminis KCTC 3681 = DSM 20184]TDG71700.1 hypothetical protein C5L30_002280 [Companilactobacillus farciminis]